MDGYRKLPQSVPLLVKPQNLRVSLADSWSGGELGRFGAAHRMSRVRRGVQPDFGQPGADNPRTGSCPGCGNAWQDSHVVFLRFLRSRISEI
jgi:hypothetical protein